jgi:hypothetical protein
MYTGIVTNSFAGFGGLAVLNSKQLESVLRTPCQSFLLL